MLRNLRNFESFWYSKTADSCYWCILQRYRRSAYARAQGIETPIAHATKTLTETQQSYSQIEREALAIIFGVKKFRQFLSGHKFCLTTDHKPLVAIFFSRKTVACFNCSKITTLCYYYLNDLPMGFRVCQLKPTLNSISLKCAEMWKFCVILTRQLMVYL